MCVFFYIKYLHTSEKSTHTHGRIVIIISPGRCLLACRVDLGGKSQHLLAISQPARTRISQVLQGEVAHLRLQVPALGNQGITPLLAFFQEAQASRSPRSEWLSHQQCQDPFSHACLRYFFRIPTFSWFLPEFHSLLICSTPVLLSCSNRSPGTSLEVPDPDSVRPAAAQEFLFLTSIWLCPWPRDLAVQPHKLECS